MIKGIIFDWTETLYERDTSQFDYSREVLDYLKKKYKLALISKAKDGVDKREKEISDSGLAPYFEIIIAGGEKTKEQFLHSIKSMGLKPNEVAVVGDRTIREIKIGNSIGCETYWVEYDDGTHKWKYDYKPKKINYHNDYNDNDSICCKIL